MHKYGWDLHERPGLNLLGPQSVSVQLRGGDIVFVILAYQQLVSE